MELHLKRATSVPNEEKMVQTKFNFSDALSYFELYNMYFFCFRTTITCMIDACARCGQYIILTTYFLCMYYYQKHVVLTMTCFIYFFLSRLWPVEEIQRILFSLFKKWKIQSYVLTLLGQGNSVLNSLKLCITKTK